MEDDPAAHPQAERCPPGSLEPLVAREGDRDPARGTGAELEPEASVLAGSHDLQAGRRDRTPRGPGDHLEAASGETGAVGVDEPPAEDRQRAVGHGHGGAPPPAPA
jgi:hypothetical protein